MPHSLTSTPADGALARVLDVDLLALDLESCTRCRDTSTNIEQAVELLTPVLATLDTELRFRRTVVRSEQQALELGFVSSPTVRVNGQDIVLETRESHCDSCTDLCGCAEGTSCREWSYRGEVHSAAPVGLVVEALLGTLARTAAQSASAAPIVAVPENLRRFFVGRAEPAEGAACCSAREREDCCESTDKDACCGTGEPSSCGCR